MNLALTDQQEEMAAAVGTLLAKELPITRVRDLAGASHERAVDDETWRACAEAGWLSAALPPALGGAGLGLTEEVVVARELGRHVAPGPFRSTMLAAHVAVEAGFDDLAAALGRGKRRAGIQIGAVAIDTHPGDLLLRLDDECFMLEVAEDCTPASGADPGIRFARVDRSQTLATVAAERLLARARVLVAAELLGITEAVRDQSAAYACERVQFGQPIGAFQAVKHRCADMAIAAYATQAQVFLAARFADSGHPDAGFHAAAAYVLATRSASRSTADNIQNHGAIGFTMEHDAHLFLRRTLVLEHVLGPPRRSRLAVLQPASHEFR